MQQDPLLKTSLPLSGAGDARRYAASAMLDGASIASPKIFPAARIAWRGVISDRQQSGDGFGGSDLARFAEAIEMPSGPAQDSLHAEISDGRDRLKVVLLAPFNHCRKQQERCFLQALLGCGRHILRVNAETRGLPDLGVLRRSPTIQQYRKRIRQHVAPSGGQQANATDNV